MTSTNCNSNVDAARQWSLDALYKGFDDEAYVKDCEKFSQLIDEYIAALEPIERGERTFDVKALCEFIKREEELWLIGKDLHEFTYLRSAVDAGDKRALSATGRWRARASSSAAAQRVLSSPRKISPHLPFSLTIVL